MTCSGQRIKAVRILQGMTLKDVADKVGVQEATIQRYESGQIKSIPQGRLIALAKALDTSSEYLLGIGPEKNYERGADQFIEWILSPSETSGSNIKKQREFLKMDIPSLAEAVGVSRQTIYRYESGKAENMSPRILGRLAKALHTTIAYILGKTDDPHDISPSALTIQDLFAVWERAENDIPAETKEARDKSLGDRKDDDKRLIDDASEPVLNSKLSDSFRKRVAAVLENADEADVKAVFGNCSYYKEFIDKGYPLSLDTACKIADELGTSLDYLTGLTDDPNESSRVFLKQNCLQEKRFGVHISKSGADANPEPIKEFLSALEQIGALNSDGSVKAEGISLVADFITRNADILRRTMPNANDEQLSEYVQGRIYVRQASKKDSK